MAPSLARIIGAAGCLLQAPVVTGIDSGAVALVQEALHVHQGQTQATEPQSPQTADMSLTSHYKWSATKYSVGERVECQAKDGSWLPCAVTAGCPTFGEYSVHVADDFPGFDVPCFSSASMRRLLSPGDVDYLIDNSQLQHKGPGVKFRYSKNLSNVGGEYAPWNTMVVGEEPQDGWIRVDRGYFLPTEVNGKAVAVKKVRPLSKRQASEEEVTAPQLPYFPGEHAEFVSGSGEWFPARILYPGTRANTYNVDVVPEGAGSFPVVDAHATRLRKSTGLLNLARKSGRGQSVCQTDGCLVLRIRRRSGEEFFVQAVKTARLETALRSACSKLELEWEDCRDQGTLKYQGRMLSPDTIVSESGLTDQAVVNSVV